MVTWIFGFCPLISALERSGKFGRSRRKDLGPSLCSEGCPCSWCNRCLGKGWCAAWWSGCSPAAALEKGKLVSDVESVSMLRLFWSWGPLALAAAASGPSVAPEPRSTVMCSVSSSSPSSSSSSAARRTILLRRAALGPRAAGGGGGGGAGGGGVGAREAGSAAPASIPAEASVLAPVGLPLGAAGRTGQGEQEPPPPPSPSPPPPPPPPQPPPHHGGATAGPGASKAATEQIPALPGGGNENLGLPGTRARPGATLQAGGCGGCGGAGAAEPPNAHGRPRCGRGAAAGAGAVARGAPRGGKGGGGGGLLWRPELPSCLALRPRCPEPLTRRVTPPLTPLLPAARLASLPGKLSPRVGWLQRGAQDT